MRRQAIVWGLLVGVVAVVVGCKQQCFLPECDYDHYRQLMPQQLECTAGAPILPETTDVPEPATVLSPERKIRYMALAEAIALALEQGTLGGNVILPDIVAGQGINVLADLPLTFTGTTVIGSDAIRVLALNPSIRATDIESSLSKFDARWLASASWTTTDRPVGTALDTFQTFAGQNSIQQQQSSVITSLVKPLPTGGVAGITFETDYNLSNLNQRVNPAYTPTLRVGFEQPLLQGFGTEINQIRASHPGSTLFQFTNLARTEGILLTRLRFDESRIQFEFEVSMMLLRVEAAYWNLYGAYWNLYSREEALRQAYGTWRINKLQFDAGRVSILELAQSRGQYELFRSQRLQALGNVLEQERRLRAVLNLPAEDGTRLVPIDAPTVAPYAPDWQAAVNDAMTLSPSIQLGRAEVKSRQLALINEKNLLLPDVRLAATYDWNAIGSALDGPDKANGLFHNAFANLADGKFSNWNIAIRGEVPIGFRDAHAGVRRARLELAQSYQQLRDQEGKVQRFLMRVYRDIFEAHERIASLRAQREAFAQELSARFEQFRAGKVTMNFLLEAQRNWADALNTEYQNIVEYNQALAAFEFAKGTMLAYDNVVIAEGPLPKCAQVRATEHFRERSKALIVRERAEPADCPACRTIDGGCCNGPKMDMAAGVASVPMVPETPPSLISLWKHSPPVPEIGAASPEESKAVMSFTKPAGVGGAAPAPAVPAAATVRSAPEQPAKPLLFSKEATVPAATGWQGPPRPTVGNNVTNDVPGVVPASYQAPATNR
ncbi:hypothetical protein AYO44_10610 [Planctomycetaceae bacterium SCGC AG-212-F19]|nr:hypothetical protein AYO44_10610 [Planctomycetaceae bacterium SCGC AG-212-F19]